MIQTLIGIALLFPLGRADEAAEGEYKILTSAYTKAVDAFEKKLDAAKTEKERAEIEAQNPGPKFADLFLAFARRHRKEPLAFDALVIAMGASGGPQNKEGCWDRVLKALERDHVEGEPIGKIVREISGSGDASSVSLLKAVIEKNPNKKIQAKACKGLLRLNEEIVMGAERLKRDEEVRRSVEKARGKDYVVKLLEGAESAAKEAAVLKKTLAEKYAGLVVDLSIGKTAPEFAAVDIDGKKVKLSDLKGKVIVLDFWATWCGPCLEMIPHSRRLVARHKEQPFVLVSISTDADRETLQAFVKKHSMPWTHWYAAPESALIDDWEIESLPTILVLDAKGTIRFKDIREKDLDAAVEKLLREQKDDRK